MVTATQIIRTTVKATVLLGLASALVIRALQLSTDAEHPGQDEDDEYDY